MLALGLALATAAAPAAPPAGGTSPGISAPERLTAGPADQLLGALAPDGRTLFFVSNEEATMQVYAEDLARGLPLPLFDEIADVTWPRPSPDGKRLLYISYRTDAAGDLCVRDLRPGGAGARRCLTDERTAELQAVWMPDGQGIAVVTRPGLHGDLELRRVPLAGGEPEVLLKANLSSPALSPDGRWLAYVPVERESQAVGPSFLARASGKLAVTRLPGDPAGGPVTPTLDLPGASGFPAFSLDGRWLYFTQYLNDTNLDGVVDGKDNGVLFRAAFTDGQLGQPQQLSSARWSCQYPVPAKDLLVVTCLSQGSLDVYSLPLEGGVPARWSPERIDDEIAASRDRWDELLLLSHRGRGDDDPGVLLRMIRLHLELGEFESASFYAERLAKTDAAAGQVLAELAAHRKSDRALSRGLLSADFVRGARARLARLAPLRHPLAALARSEIHDTLAEEEQARAALEGVDTTDPLAAALYAERLLALYRGEARYFELYRPLAERDLEHAQAFARELLRGVASAGRGERLDGMMRTVDPDSELAFVLALERSLSDLTPGTQEPVRERVFTLYRKNKEYARRKALVDITVQRARADDNEDLLYNFADTWVSYVPRERAERRHAERLFRDAVLERAYVEAARGRVADARGRFYAVTLQTESLEAHAGFIEGRLAEKLDPRADYAGKPESVVVRFARAYLLARGLPRRTDLPAHERDVQAALADLQAIAAEAPQRAEVHGLWAYVDHQRYLRTGARLAAVEANAHALLALDLARDRPRERATALALLARIQGSVGNFAIALGWLEERAKLPFVDDAERLAHCLADARARFHAAVDPAAGAVASDACVAALGPELERFRPVALDRSALYHLVAGDAQAAGARYAALWPLVEKQAGPEGARNRLTTQVGWAAATLATGQAGAALEHVTAAERLVGSGGGVALDGPYGRWRPPAGAGGPADEHVLLLAGLRAQAHAALGQLPEAAAAMTRRRDGLAARVARVGIDADRLALASAEAQLALYAHRGKAPEQALGHLRAALAQWDAWSASTGTPVEETGLAILGGYAELHLFAGVALERLGLDLPGRLAASYTQLSQVRNPAWEPMRDRFEIYLTLLHLGRTRS